LLDCDLDLVVLASPPAFRPLHFEAAVRAGKHVFMEMPIATDVPGVRRVLEANERAKARGLSVAVGLPRRHEKRYQETIRRLHDGAIGQVVLARAYWNAGPVAAHTRQAKDTELSDQLRNWRRFPWLSGDLVVEQHVQNLDVIHWLKGDVPLECNGIATRDNHLAPDPRLACEQHFVEYAFADGSRLFSQCRRKDHCWNVVSEYAHGTKGYANISSGRICDRAGTPIWSFGSGESRGAQEQQFQLMTALRRGELLNEVDHASKSTLMAILGRTATYTGRVERWSDLLNSSLPMADVDRLCGGDTAVM
jgi:predicted dehydrogenase